MANYPLLQVTIFATILKMDIFAEGEKVKVIEAMRHWEENTCIRFHDRTNQTSYINFFQGSGCVSYLNNLP